MRFLTCLLLSSALAAPAVAAPIKFKPLVDARLRYENVDQTGIAKKADAVTARVRLGGELSSGPFSFLAESEATLALEENYNSGVNGKGTFPIVADPENVELNRLQVQFKGLPKTVVTLGRQRINLDDQRFVGSVGWRDNEQTFDAARIEWTGIKSLKVDLTYSWNVNTIWGIDGGKFGATNRPQTMDGNNIFGNISYATKYGTLTGFGYAINEDQSVVVLRRNSSLTLGGRFAGAKPLSKTTKITYAASYASQSDTGTNPLNYSADYYLVEAGLEVKALKVGLGMEVLGSDTSVTTKTTGAAFAGGFGFQTPFATLHKFQGWADKFLTTPPQGLADYYGSLGYGWKKVGPFDTIVASAIYHRFDTDAGSTKLGEEINLQIVGKVKKYTFTAKYADYNSQSALAPAGTDTKKLWLSAEWAF